MSGWGAQIASLLSNHFLSEKQNKQWYEQVSPQPHWFPRMQKKSKDLSFSSSSTSGSHSGGSVHWPGWQGVSSFALSVLRALVSL